MRPDQKMQQAYPGLTQGQMYQRAVMNLQQSHPMSTAQPSHIYQDFQQKAAVDARPPNPHQQRFYGNEQRSPQAYEKIPMKLNPQPLTSNRISYGYAPGIVGNSHENQSDKSYQPLQPPIAQTYPQDLQRPLRVHNQYPTQQQMISSMQRKQFAPKPSQPQAMMALPPTAHTSFPADYTLQSNLANQDRVMEYDTAMQLTTYLLSDIVQNISASSRQEKVSAQIVEAFAQIMDIILASIIVGACKSKALSTDVQEQEALELSPEDIARYIRTHYHLLS